VSFRSIHHGTSLDLRGAASAAQLLPGMNARSSWSPARWVVPLFALAALLLVPWVVLLVFSLPSTQRAAHWDIAWAGFDVALALLLLSVAIAAFRRSPWLEGAATAAATLLFVDAWFDVLTSSTRTELLISSAEAILVELPLAVLCLLLARAAERRLRVVPLPSADSAHVGLHILREAPVESSSVDDRLSA
jgi:hypothetical protein